MFEWNKITQSAAAVYPAGKVRLPGGARGLRVDRAMSNRPSTVAVIGAGVAGLAAAWHLQQAGAAVTVLEARDWLGGRTRTDVVDGYRVDAGIQLFGSMYREFFRVLNAVGAGDRAVRTAGRDALWRDGRVHEVVYGSVASMVASGALPFATKVKMGTTYLPFLLRHQAVLDLHHLDRAAAAGLDRESIAAWGERELGRDFVEYLAAPLLAAYYGTTPEETTATLYHVLAQGGMDVEVFALRGGAAGWCEAVADAVRRGGATVQTGKPVRRVEPDGSGARLTGDEWSAAFDAAVVATSAPRALRLLPPDSALARSLAPVRYSATASLALLLDRPLGVRYFGLSLPRRHFPTVAAVCVEENKDAALVPAGRGLLVVFPTPEAGARLVNAEPREVLNLCLTDLERVFPGLSARVVRAKSYHWPNWHPVFAPGTLQRLAQFPGTEGGICLAGDYLVVPGAEGAAVAGRRAAERVLRHPLHGAVP